MKPIYWALLFLAIGLILWLISRSQQKSSGLPKGELLYSDNKVLQNLPKLLHDPELELVGRPDYVIRDDAGFLIPVELKSASAPNQPYASHIIQLIAYCRLVDVHFGQRPPYGIIQYKDRAFKIAYNQKNEQKLYDLISQFRDSSQNSKRSHSSVGRCRGCGYASICDESLL